MLLEVAERRLKGIFHLAGSTRISRYQFALRLARKFEFNENMIVPVKSESIDWKAKRPFDSSLNVTKALETLNSKPVPIEEALEDFARETPKP
jgi:dTDP-4-dehydrorhamnose reductase